MGVFSVHMQKFSMIDVKGLEIEVDRKSRNLKNKDIDYSLSGGNIDLVKPKVNLYTDIKNRVEELKQLGSRVQKNSVTCAGFVFTIPEDIKKDSSFQEKYFNICVEYLQEKFNKENVIQATIHTDEFRPHLHVYLVPENLENGKLQARKSLDRNFLNDLHSKLPTMLIQEGFNIHRGNSTDKYYIENIHDYKNAMKEIERLNQEKAKLTEDLEKEKSLKAKEAKDLKDEIELLKASKMEIDGSLHKSKSEFLSIKNYISKYKSDINKYIPVTKLPFNKVVISETDLKKVLKVARDTNLQKKLNKDFEDSIFRSENPLKILEKTVKKNRKLQSRLEKLLSEATEAKIRHENKYDEQLYINKEFNALKLKYKRLSDDFMEQSLEIKKLVEENKDLHYLLDSATDSFKSITMAINCLVYDDNYKLDLDKKRKNLLKAIDKYTIDKLEIYGFIKKAEELSKTYGISRGIQNEISKLSKRLELDI